MAAALVILVSLSGGADAGSFRDRFSTGPGSTRSFEVERGSWERASAMPVRDAKQGDWVELTISSSTRPQPASVRLIVEDVRRGMIRIEGFDEVITVALPHTPDRFVGMKAKGRVGGLEIDAVCQEAAGGGAREHPGVRVCVSSAAALAPSLGLVEYRGTHLGRSAYEGESVVATKVGSGAASRGVSGQPRNIGSADELANLLVECLSTASSSRQPSSP